MSVLKARKEKRKARESKRADRELLTRAMKATGVKPEHMLTDAQEILMLQKYIEGLAKVAEELERRYGTDANDALLSVRVEKENCIRRVARLMQNQVKPAQLKRF